MIYRTKSPHIGGSFSMIELLTVLYFKILRVDPKNPGDLDRDRFLLSKGHGVPALYAILAEKGFIDEKTLAGFAQDGGTLEQHPNRDVQRGIEMTSGSLGHGLSVGVGMALAGKYNNKGYRTFVLLGDGEMEEGSSWEAILFAGHHKLDKLIAIIDYNKLQAIGKVSEILDLDPLGDKFKSFNWEVKEVDGHNIKEIINTLENIPFKTGKPSCLIANTIKGKGVSFMEGDPKWHDRCPDDNEYRSALEEL